VRQMTELTISRWQELRRRFSFYFPFLGVNGKRNDIKSLFIPNSFMRFYPLISIMSIGLMAIPSVAEGPRFRHKDPLIQQELVNSYSDLRAISNRALETRTKAQIQTTIPYRVGLTYFCTDCTTDAVCVSTGVGTGDFSRLSARTTACQ
jgi:hypothetical protein